MRLLGLTALLLPLHLAVAADTTADVSSTAIYTLSEVESQIDAYLEQTQSQDDAGIAARTLPSGCALAVRALPLSRSHIATATRNPLLTSCLSVASSPSL